MTDPEKTLEPNTPRNWFKRALAWAGAHPHIVLLALTHSAAFLLGVVMF